jgi:hypothetical protein
MALNFRFTPPLFFQTQRLSHIYAKFRALALGIVSWMMAPLFLKIDSLAMKHVLEIDMMKTKTPTTNWKKRKRLHRKTRKGALFSLYLSLSFICPSHTKRP